MAIVSPPLRLTRLVALAFGREGQPPTAVTPTTPLPVRNIVSEDVDQIPQPVRGNTPRVTAQFTKPADNTPYAQGDHLTATPAAPLFFATPRPSGRVSGARAVISVGAGAVVWPAFDLLLFRPVENVPFASNAYPADNAGLTLSAAAYRELVAVIPFTATGWRNATGANAATGLVGYQPGVPVLRPFAPFNVAGLGQQGLRGIVHAQSAWGAGNAAYTIDFALDVDCD